MIERAWKRYESVLKQLETDEEYRMLEAELASLAPRLREVLTGLPPESRQIIATAMALDAEMSQRALEIACFEDKKPVP